MVGGNFILSLSAVYYTYYSPSIFTSPPPPHTHVQNSGSPHSSTTHSPPQRVHSQTQYDRKHRPDSAPIRRPSTAQGFHADQPSPVSQDQQPRKKISLSHTQTSV